MAGKAVSLQLEAATLDELAARSRETGESRSRLAQRYIEEGLRMERYPGIVFRDGPAGRRAALVGGPDVWEVIPEIRDLDADNDAEVTAVATWLNVPPSRIRAALGYYAEYADEIDTWIEENTALAERAAADWRASRISPEG
jgi:hypothetical protein